MGRAPFFLEAPRENLFSCLLWFLEATRLLVAPSVFKAGSGFLVFLTQHGSKLTLLPPLPHVRTLTITLGPPRPPEIMFPLLSLIPSVIFVPLCDIG